jgi:hypothetical protein
VASQVNLLKSSYLGIKVKVMVVMVHHVLHCVVYLAPSLLDVLHGILGHTQYGHLGLLFGAGHHISPLLPPRQRVCCLMTFAHDGQLRYREAQIRNRAWTRRAHLAIRYAQEPAAEKSAVEVEVEEEQKRLEVCGQGAPRGWG